jgi:hypothetical protein
MKRAKALSILFLLAAVGCGTPRPTNAGATGTTAPPSSTVPNIAGTWVGSMNFTTLTGGLKLTLTEDSSGNLSGSATSTPPGCDFDVSVSGKVYADGQLYLQTSDDATLSLAGQLTPGTNNARASGTIALGDATGCGPRSGGTFSVQEQTE